MPDMGDALIRLNDRMVALEAERDALQARAEQAEAANDAIALLLEVPEGGTGWEAIKALRARAEQAEAALREIAKDKAGQGVYVTIARNALAATTPGDQERREQMGKDYEASAAEDLATSQSIRATTPGEPQPSYPSWWLTTPGEPTMPPLETRADWYAAPAASTADLDRADHDGRQP